MHKTKFLNAHSESLFPGGFNENSLDSLGLFWAEQLLFEDTKAIYEELSGTRADVFFMKKSSVKNLLGL